MDVVLEWLRTFGATGLFIHAMIDAIIFPIPAFFLQVSLSVIHPSNALWLATVGYIGCLIGTPIGYGIGKISGKHILSRILKQQRLDSAEALFNKHGEAAIMIGSFTPIPFKIFTLLSGCMNYPLWKLIAYAALGRGVKFYIVGVMFYIYGRSAESMVGRVTTYGMLGVAVVIAAVWLTIRAVRKRKQSKGSAHAEQNRQEQSMSDGV